jgi:hypothetical protein
VRGAQWADAAAAGRQLLHVGQLALVHPFLDEPRVHAVEAENHQLLLKLLRRTPRPARGDHAETQHEHGEKGVFHRAFGEKKLYHLESW